jgi:hypothetical protein
MISALRRARASGVICCRFRVSFFWTLAFFCNAFNPDLTAFALDLAPFRRNCKSMTIHIPPQVTPFERPPEQVAFHRTELSVILSLYGRMVAAGEWRDYGISCLRDVAVFSVFRRTAEIPLYRIEKRPKLRNRQGMYAVIGTGGQVLRRGHDLKAVLRVLERKLIRAVE